MAQQGADSHSHSLFELTDKDLSSQNDTSFSAAVLKEIATDLTKSRQNPVPVKTTEEILFWDGSEEHRDVGTDRFGQNERTLSGYIDYKSGKDAGKRITFTKGAELDVAQKALAGELDQKMAWRTTTTDFAQGYSTFKECTSSGLCNSDESVAKGNLNFTVHFGLEGQYQSAEANLKNADGSSARLVFNVEQKIGEIDLTHADGSKDVRHFDYMGRLQSTDHLAEGATTHKSYDPETGKLI